MAALAADIAAVWDPRWEIGMIQKPCAAADIFYRGGIGSSVVADSTLTLTPVNADFYAGVIMEHKVTTAAAELVWVASAGRWFFTCANFSDANVNETFAIQATDLFDNPATLDVTGATDVGAVGTLWVVSTSGTNGWLDTDNRFLIVNA